MTWVGSYSRDADAIGRWYAAEGGDASWAARRARVTTLLAEADRLTALADLVGAGSLPGHERMVILTGRLLREAVLQQSALSDQDMQCSPAKSAALVELVLAVASRCQQLVGAGLPAATVEAVDFSPVVRAREETGPSDVAGVRRHREAMFAVLEALS